MQVSVLSYFFFSAIVYRKWEKKAFLLIFLKYIRCFKQLKTALDLSHLATYLSENYNTTDQYKTYELKSTII